MPSFLLALGDAQIDTNLSPTEFFSLDFQGRNLLLEVFHHPARKLFDVMKAGAGSPSLGSFLSTPQSLCLVLNGGRLTGRKTS